MNLPRSKKLKNGSCLVTLQVDEKAWALAELVWQRLLYTGPEDYLNGVLNTAMMYECDRHYDAEEQRTGGSGSPPPGAAQPAGPLRDPAEEDELPF